MDNLSGFKLDFVGVGFPRCGTTWVAKALQQHLQVDFSRVKETNYFCSKGDHTLALSGNPFKIKSYKEYVQLFKNDGNIRGEFSTNYIIDPKSMKNISTQFPKTKLIVCLRDPVQALYSTYWYLKNSHRSSELPNTIQGCIHKPTPLFSKMLATFKYDAHLKELFQYFDKKQVHFIYYSDIVNNKQKVLYELFTFLNIDRSFVPQGYDKRVNTFNKSRFPFVNTAVSYTIKFLRLLKLERYYYSFIVRFPVFTKTYNKYMRTADEKDSLNKEEELELYKIYSSSIKNLEHTLKTNLERWKRYQT